jgi:hypothetical protein
MATGDHIFGPLVNELSNVLRDPHKLQTIDRNDLYKTIEFAIDMHKKMNMTFQILSKDELFVLKDRFQATLAKKPNTAVTKISLKLVNAYFDNLGTTAKHIDKSFGPFYSLNKASTETVNILNKIKVRFNEFFSDQFLTLNEVRLSTLSIINFIMLAEVTCACSEYLFSIILDTINDYPSPQYRYRYLEKYMGTLMKWLNDVLEHQGIFNVVANMDNMKREGSDALIASGYKVYNFAFVTKIGSVLKSFFKTDNFSPAKGIGLFRRVGELWDNYLHEKYKKNQNRLEWMQSRISLFKAQMAGMNTDSAEYHKLNKIVEVYDTEITKLDKKIQSYLEED